MNSNDEYHENHDILHATNTSVKEEKEIIVAILHVQLHLLLLRLLQRGLLRFHQIMQRHDRPHKRTEIQQLPVIPPLHSHHVYVIRLDGHRLLNSFQLLRNTPQDTHARSGGR